MVQIGRSNLATLVIVYALMLAQVPTLQPRPSLPGPVQFEASAEAYIHNMRAIKRRYLDVSGPLLSKLTFPSQPDPDRFVCSQACSSNATH